MINQTLTNQTSIPFMEIRGGSSKGIYFNNKDLPQSTKLRNQVLKHVMGAEGDPRQIDGMGGAAPLTSKIAIISSSNTTDRDIDYTFIQAVVGEDRLDDSPNCGNLLSGVGAFALESGMLKREGSFAEIIVHMTNSAKNCLLKFSIKNGLPIYHGDAKIDGVLGSGAPILCFYSDLAGSTCGSLLPTGNKVDHYDNIKVTCIDNGMPAVVLSADDFGISGTETVEELEANENLKNRLESIRLSAGKDMNLGDVLHKTVPKMCLISKSQSHAHLNTRIFIPHKCHQAIGVLGAVSVASAAVMEGSAIFNLVKKSEGDQRKISIEHPSGVFDIQLELKKGEVINAGVLRTARPIAKGEVYIPKSVWQN